jgi:hypothetical protein
MHTACNLDAQHPSARHKGWCSGKQISELVVGDSTSGRPAYCQHAASVALVPGSNYNCGHQGGCESSDGGYSEIHAIDILSIKETLNLYGS